MNKYVGYILGYATVCLFLLSCSDKASVKKQEFDFSPVSFIKGYLATENFKKHTVDKNYEAALSAAIKAKENLSSNLAVDNNLGVAFEIAGKPNDAEKTLTSALKNQADKNDMLFLINYNLGVHFGALNQVDQALAYYQAALDIKPESKETKHNIELLIQQQQQQQNQQNQNQQQQQDQNKDSQNQSGQQGESKNNQKDDQKNNDNQDKDDQKKNDKKQGDRKSNPKYKPRPFQGDQLSEGDVKKILGELSQQDKKIRQQYDQKEPKNSKEMKNEKDW